ERGGTGDPRGALARRHPRLAAIEREAKARVEGDNPGGGGEFTHDDRTGMGRAPDALGNAPRDEDHEESEGGDGQDRAHRMISTTGCHCHKITRNQFSAISTVTATVHSIPTPAAK